MVWIRTEICLRDRIGLVDRAPSMVNELSVVHPMSTDVPIDGGARACPKIVVYL